MARRRRRGRRVRLGVAAMFLLCLLAGGAAGYMIKQTPAPPGYADMLARVAPSIVVVNTLSRETSFRGYRTSEVEGNGSGVYIGDGLVLTNNHVVQDATMISVAAESGASATVTDFSYDEEYDLALLYVGETLAALTPVPIGDSDALRVGDAVLVVGYPGTGDAVLGQTLTSGVVSALHRTGVSAGNVSESVGMIQTDAAINGGNSGGALLNAAGELVGIPTMKLQSAYGTAFESLGFAVPITDAMATITRMTEELDAYRTMR